MDVKPVASTTKQDVNRHTGQVLGKKPGGAWVGALVEVPATEGAV